jgi:hypothetical protein
MIIGCSCEIYLKIVALHLNLLSPISRLVYYSMTTK